MGKSTQFHDGFRYAIKFAVEHIHREAARMNDPQARMFYNNMAFWLGQEMAHKHNDLQDITQAEKAFAEYQKNGGIALEAMKKELGIS